MTYRPPLAVPWNVPSTPPAASSREERVGDVPYDTHEGDRPPADEWRERSPTGGEKGQKLARFDLIPPAALWKIAEVFGRGARKYDERNWERGYDWSLSFAACMRHLWAWWRGEDRDPESGQSHLAHAAFHVLALLTYEDTHPEFDNRPHTWTWDEDDDA